MGNSNLPKIAAAPTEVEATSTQYNAVVDALHGDLVARNSSGVKTDGAGDIGEPGGGRFDKLHLKTGMTVANRVIDFSTISLHPSGVTSGKSKVSGFPNFLTPLGVDGGATNTFTIEAESTNLIMTIDGVSYKLEIDLVSDDLALAPGANNLCDIDDTFFADQDLTKYVGEHGYYITIDNIGSEITDSRGTLQCFKHGSEVFIGKLDAVEDYITPRFRGIGGTAREVFSDDDTITLLKAHYIFLDKDLATVDTTTNYPIWSAIEPAAPATGDRWWDVVNTTWKRYSGASWETLGQIYLGYAICDDADCLYVQHEDYNIAWNELCYFNTIETDAADRGLLHVFGDIKVNVANNLVFSGDVILDKDSDFVSGESDPATGWIYIYIDNLGNIFLSTTAPRPKDHKLGWYHPNEYWRLLSMAYKYEAASILMMSHSSRENLISYQDDWDWHNTPTTGLYDSYVCPIIRHAEIDWRTTLPNGATIGKITITSLDRDPVTQYLMGFSSSAFVPASYTLKSSGLFRSGIMNITVTGFNALDINISKIFINL